MVVFAQPERVASALGRVEGELVAPPQLRKHDAIETRSKSAPSPEVAADAAPSERLAPFEAESPTDETVHDYTAILLNSLPIDAAPPIDHEHMRQQRVTIVFESGESAESAKSAESDAAQELGDASDEAQADETPDAEESPEAATDTATDTQ
jgi:hypothetical protein